MLPCDGLELLLQSCALSIVVTSTIKNKHSLAMNN